MDVMPRRGMGVEMPRDDHTLDATVVMPRRGMGVEILNLRRESRLCLSCPAGAWE